VPCQVAKLLHGKVVVGHAVHHDFQSLAYVHPPSHTRDTQKIPLLNLKCDMEVQRTMSLKAMSKTILNDDIQVSSITQHIGTRELSVLNQCFQCDQGNCGQADDHP